MSKSITIFAIIVMALLMGVQQKPKCEAKVLVTYYLKGKMVYQRVKAWHNEYGFKRHLSDENGKTQIDADSSVVKILFQ